jgi:NAD(P)-dependent dehydrogenase (short-subunit alcohol dehydrogenase family)
MDKPKKTVLLTGGSRGIGLGIYNLLTQRGYNVIASTRKELDLSDSSSLENFIIKKR